MLNDPKALLNALKNYGDKISKITRTQIEKVKSMIADPVNNLENILNSSKAAAGLLTWVKATVNLYDVNKKVEPLKAKLE